MVDNFFVAKCLRLWDAQTQKKNMKQITPGLPLKIVTIEKALWVNNGTSNLVLMTHYEIYLNIQTHDNNSDCKMSV